MEEQKNYRLILLEEMRTGMYANSHRLPPEVEIGKQFGISRTMVRDVLSILEQEGYVTRKQGIGTLINHNVLNLPNRIDIEKEFLEMVRSYGYEASVRDIQMTLVEAEEAAVKLKVSKGTKFIKSVRTILADGKPAIYVEDFVAESLIKTPEYEMEESPTPIFGFLEKYCNTEVYLDLSEVKAINADQRISRILEIEKGEAIVYIDEVGYNMEGQPVLYSKEYYGNGIFQHMIMRKKI